MDEVDDEEDDPDPIDFYTYWGPNAASRLDRFYVPQTWTGVVQWISVEEPAAPSDHQRVRLHLRNAEKPQSRQRRQRYVSYPIKTAQPGRVHTELLEELIEAEVGKEVSAATWDQTTRTCVECIKKVKKRETQRRNAVIRKLHAQNRAHLLTRKELMAATVEDSREEHLVRMGQRLERTVEQLRWQFKRISNWERDQRITTIRQVNGAAFRREMTVADKFASEWKPILGKTHNTTPSDEHGTEFDQFVQIPANRRISEADNEKLMAEITQEEVIKAIAALNRHKAAGADGLNNDFFKDAQAVLVPAMLAIGNELLKGGGPPASFLEGLIIPLRKKGDSDDAMDYRPIALLQTGYKVFAKIMATRVQRILGKPIGESQQGFVHGRQMLKTVMMMMAMLASAKNEPGLAASLSRVILLLDFRKAYDTVARDFLFLALLRFGFSPYFVEMIRKLHHGTTAQFLVNGELSAPQEVISGIRQGCPLAPLLFLLAAEILALAIQQEPAVTGIKVPGGDGATHKFSAFVDDSTVFMQEARQLSRVMNIVKKFGRLSGLQVQPTKSKIIFLNTAVVLHEYEGIPVLRSGDTVRYLGYAVGTGMLADVNWAVRIRNIQRRLATATQLATSVENRVTILNVIMLPAVLFTAAVFEIPQWADSQLRNLQKQFLWQHSISTDSSRNKINPALLYTPKQAAEGHLLGGVADVGIPGSNSRVGGRRITPRRPEAAVRATVQNTRKYPTAADR
ncbi:hypothetical protein PR001_g9006 [Phytophthora rubi]|nr:hypothetical protein PR001_g9006 [Phytophthora rubi]